MDSLWENGMEMENVVLLGMDSCQENGIDNSDLQERLGNNYEQMNTRRFHVLDEIENDSESQGSESYDSDLPDDEVEKMLEEAMVTKKRTADQAGLGNGYFPFCCKLVQVFPICYIYCTVELCKWTSPSRK